MSVRRTAKVPLPAMEALSFEHPHLVLVEGADDAGVLAEIIEHEELEGFHIHDMQGNTGWPTSLRVAALDPGFRRTVRSIGLVADADDSPDRTFQRCESVLLAAGLPRPEDVGPGSIRTRILVMPDGANSGAIEDMFLGMADVDRLEHVDNYFSRLLGSGLAHAQGSALSKARLQAYLAGMPAVARNVTGAIRKGLFDLGHPALDHVKEFLRSLVVSDPC